jgi:hypothetical protein
MSVLLLVMTDGRDELLERTISSAEDNLIGNITRAIIHTDRDSQHVSELIRRYPDFEVCGGSRGGFGSAINRAWGIVKHADEDYVFHLEDDFVFNWPLNLRPMIEVLEHRPHVVQLALRRQSWNEAEEKAGGIVEMWPDEYKDCEWNGYQWLEHRLHFTTNPSLYRRVLTRTGWPTGPRSEHVFSDALFSDPLLRAAYWGPRDSAEWVHHIGAQRIGSGY